jgi:hypothetical protein
MKCDLGPDRISKLRPRDIAEIDTIFETGAKYLILKIGKSDKYIRALPLGEYIKNEPTSKTTPVLDIPFYMIKRFKKIDKSMLLFLINQDNPHILDALTNMVDK